MARMAVKTAMRSVLFSFDVELSDNAVGRGQIGPCDRVIVARIVFIPKSVSFIVGKGRFADSTAPVTKIRRPPIVLVDGHQVSTVVIKTSGTVAVDYQG